MGGDCREAGSGLTPERTVLLELQRKGKRRGGGRKDIGGRVGGTHMRGLQWTNLQRTMMRLMEAGGEHSPSRGLTPVCVGVSERAEDREASSGMDH